MEGYVATEDGVRLFFEILGEGDPRIVVPNGPYLRRDLARLTDHTPLVLYDLRHRGRSEGQGDPRWVGRGIRNDVEDLETVRRHFGLESMALLAHSYAAFMAVLYARDHPTRVSRVVQVGPLEPYPGKAYPPHRSAADGVAQEVFARLQELRGRREAFAPEAFCREFWSILRLLYVTDPTDAGRIDWGRCDLPNERAAYRYWTETIWPSLLDLGLRPADWAGVRTPVLVVHGRKDRSAPYGGGRDWAGSLREARLVTVPQGGHAPWIEAPEVVFGAIRTFLEGEWPKNAEQVESAEPPPCE